MLMESFLSSGATQALAMRADWAKWRASVRGNPENPLMERILSDSAEGPETVSAKGDWRLKIEAAAPEKRADLIMLALLDVVGGVLRVKPETLRADQPLTDLGLDSLMAVEIETSLEATIGVALPPASLMRARTINQIAVLICDHLAGSTDHAAKAGAPTEPPPAGNVDLEAFSDDEIEQLLGEADATGPARESAAKS